MKKYLTSQREILYSFLKSHSDEQFTIYEIAEKLCERNNISKSSIYRNIGILVNEGLVQSYTEGNKKLLYQYIGEQNCSCHLHLKCTVCGQITHLDNNSMDVIYDSIAKKNGFNVDTNKTIIYGECTNHNKIMKEDN